MKQGQPFDILRLIEVECSHEEDKVLMGASFPQNKFSSTKIRYYCQKCDITYFQFFWKYLLPLLWTEGELFPFV